jgi:hypothetical protein
VLFLFFVKKKERAEKEKNEPTKVYFKRGCLKLRFLIEFCSRISSLDVCIHMRTLLYHRV